jgi:hypothetical protein
VKGRWARGKEGHLQPSLTGSKVLEMTGDVHRQTQKSTRNAGFHSDTYASDTGRMVEKQSCRETDG